MNFLLKDLELNLEDALLEKAEQLIVQESVIGLNEIEKNLWVAVVNDEMDYEVEIQISPSKVKAYTCDCVAYQQYGLCQHITAVLIELREIIKQKKAFKKSQKPAKEKPKRLTTTVIIKNATPEELAEFVKNYARENRQFALALKARFASKIGMEDIEDKYLQLLESAINASRRQGFKISPQGQKQLYYMIEELINQTEDAISIQNHSEACAIIKTLLNKLPGILPLIKNKEVLLKNIDKTLSIFKQMIIGPIAPQLKEELWQSAVFACEHNMGRSGQDIDLLYLDLLLKLANEGPQIEDLLSVIDLELSSPSLKKKKKVKLLINKIHLLEKNQQPELIHQLLEQHQDEMALINISIEKAIEKKDWKAAEAMALKGMQNNNLKSFQQEMLEYLLSISSHHNDQTAIEDYSKKLYLLSLDLKYYYILKENIKSDWESYFESLLEEIQALPYSLEKRDNIAEVLAQENKKEDLIKYIGKIKSLDLLKRYDRTLLPEQNEAVIKLYTDFLNDYLKQHLGIQPVIKVVEVINHIIAIPAKDIAKQLKKNILTNFSDRNALVKELGGL